MKQATYPKDHRPAMQVPPGGSNCAKCSFHRDDGNRCASPDYQRYYGTDKIPLPPDQFCSDWFEARSAVRQPVAGPKLAPEPMAAQAFYGG